MTRVVIADAGPLIALAKIDQLGLLQALFGGVTITSVVANEVLADDLFPETPVLKAALKQDWMSILSVTDDWQVECHDWMNLYQIDLGEATSLTYASRCKAAGDPALVVLDDARGRAAAEHADIALIGTVGLLLLAKNRGLVPAVKPLLLHLRSHGYFLSERLMRAAIEQAAEV